MSVLFSPFQLRGIEFRNRIFVAPMCMYSAEDGMPHDWHMVHLGSRAVGGAALVISEATAVSPEGRISPADTGIWDEAQVKAWEPINAFIRSQGAVPGVQLAHAGRKASSRTPWEEGVCVPPEDGGWQVVGPTGEPFAEGYPVPRAMSEADIEKVVSDFAAAARRSLAAGFEVAEIHMAHGYLMHQFLSPLVNRRTDDYGGSLENRMRLPLRVAEAVRAEWPDDRPVLARLSATDWLDGGWDADQSVELSRRLKVLGIDLIDCSSGGAVPGAKIPLRPGYQVPFAARIRSEAQVPTGAVGLITSPEHAEAIVAGGYADVVLLARELLRDPYWPLHAARILGDEAPWPRQYVRAGK